MIYKEDWNKSAQRYEAFWQGVMLDRCCFAVTAPLGKPPAPRVPERAARDLEQKWLDPEFRLEQSLRSFAGTYYGGDAYPMFWNNLGPGVAAAFMGAGWRLAEGTVWFDADPPFKDWANRRAVRLDTESRMWKAAWELTKLFCEHAGDDYLVGITDLGGSMDIAASLRGSDRLLMDLYDNPDDVKKLVKEIDAAWKPAYDRLQSLIGEHQQGSCAWMGMWCPGRWYPLQCDFSAMISRRMFEDFVLPSLAQEAEWFDRVIYHLDGPGEICHLESILEIENINGIQCVPGTMFHERTGDCYQSFCNELWMPVLKRIQSKGRLLVLNEVHPIELGELMENLSPEGLFLSMECKTEAEAREMARRIEGWR
jgi:hypothetical protein